MYGKRPTKPLSVTANQFLRSNDIFSTPSDAPEIGTAQAKTPRTNRESSSDSDDSPLSDAEPSDPVQNSHFANKEPPSLADRNAAPVLRRGVAPSPTTTGEHGRRPAQKPRRRTELPTQRTDPAIHEQATDASQRVPKTTPAAKAVKAKRKAPRRKRRLPVNELLLVPEPCQDDKSSELRRDARTVLQEDPVSSSAFPLVDNVSSDESDSSIEPRKRKSPLTAIRKRLKTPVSEQKSFKMLRPKHGVGTRAVTADLPPPKLGDGFEASELQFSSRASLRPLRMGLQRRQQPVWEGLQALSLTAGPLPDVTFDHPSSTLKVEASTEVEKALQFGEDDERFVADAGTPPAAQAPASVPLSRRRVSFSDRVFAELSSVSAPRRRYSNSDDGEGEDDEAVESYVDGHHLDADNVMDEDEPMLSDEERAIRPSSRHTSPTPEPQTPSHRPPPPPRLSPIADSEGISTGVTLDFRKQGILGTFKRTRSSKSRSMVELREVIEDDYEPDDEQEMLFESEPPAYHAPAHHHNTIKVPESTLTRKSFSCHVLIFDTDILPGQPSLGMPRSILKNSEPSISSDRTRPHNTASNTRRNSAIALDEQNHYFTSATSHLDSSPLPHRIIRLKSNQPRVQIPYSGYTVPETSPEHPDYTNATQLHVLRRNQETSWTSNRMPAPPRDMTTLTRTVSQEHGTLSQAVRRRRSMPFQGPTKLR